MAALVLVTTPAVADVDQDRDQPPDEGVTPDAVELHDGRTFRGRVEELVPDDHVTLRRRSGDPLRFEWSSVDRVVVGPGTPPPRKPPPDQLAPPRAAMTGPLVRVHLDGPSPSFLYREPADGSSFVEACDAPCDVDLPLGDTYRVSGEGFTTTKDFRLQGSPGQAVHVGIDGPNWLGVAVGGSAIVLGDVASNLGLLLTITGAATEGDEAVALGIVGLTAGAALVGLGLAILFRSVRTDLVQRPAQDRRAPSRGAAPRAGQRLDAPRPPSPDASAASLPPATFPVLFERTF